VGPSDSNCACIKAQDKTRIEHIRTRTQSLKKGKDTTAHRSLRLLPELERRLDSTLDSRQGFAYASTTKPEPLQAENYKYSVVCFEFYRENPYIEMEGSFH
jgi:hypothetical protein